MSADESPEAVARGSATIMWRQDQASRDLGMRLEVIAPGRAVLSMTIERRMVNGLDVCHGGFIFALADSAMAFASNSHGEHALAQHCAITFLRPARLGDRLVADAVERARLGRTAIYDVAVSVNDLVIAEFRGHTRSTGERFIEAAT
jgi:acyl-CoA thioesterase